MSWQKTLITSSFFPLSIQVSYWLTPESQHLWKWHHFTCEGVFSKCQFCSLDNTAALTMKGLLLKKTRDETQGEAVFEKMWNECKLWIAWRSCRGYCKASDLWMGPTGLHPHLCLLGISNPSATILSSNWYTHIGIVPTYLITLLHVSLTTYVSYSPILKALTF